MTRPRFHSRAAKIVGALQEDDVPRDEEFDGIVYPFADVRMWPDLVEKVEKRWRAGARSTYELVGVFCLDQGPGGMVVLYLDDPVDSLALPKLAYWTRELKRLEAN